MYPTEAPKAYWFCKLLAHARIEKLHGHWSGSVYRHHPCGLIRGAFILSNEWNVNEYCYASVMENPESGTTKPSNHPASWGGDPHPHPKQGEEFQIYHSGCWTGEDGPWRNALWRVLLEVEAELKDKILEAEWNRRIAEIDRKREESARWEKRRRMILTG